MMSFMEIPISERLALISSWRGVAGGALLRALFSRVTAASALRFWIRLDLGRSGVAREGAVAPRFWDTVSRPLAEEDSAAGGCGGWLLLAAR